MNNIKKIIEYGLYLLVFLLPVQTRWIIKSGEINGGYSEYNTISLYGIDILLLALLFLFTIYKIKNQKPARNASQREAGGSKCKIITAPGGIPPTILNNIRGGTIQNLKLFSNFYIWLFIVIIDLAILISIFFAQDKPLAIYSYARFLLGIGLFWLIVSAGYNKAKLIWSFILGASVQACLGIWQFITQSTFSSKWLGIAVHKAGELGTSVVETAGQDGVGERWLRAYGGLDHPNMLGGFLAVALLMLIIFYINRKPEERVSPDKIFNFQFSIFKLFCCFFILLLALFFSFSRAAWLGLAVGLLVMIFFMARQKDIVKLKRMAEIILPAVAIIFILSIFYNNLVFTRLASAGRLEVKSNIERVESYKFARDIIKKNWLLGTGIGNYTLALKNEINLKRQGYYYQPVHNIFLLVWAETGILGLAGFLGLIVYLIINYQLSIINKFSKLKIIENCKLKIVNLDHGYSDKDINREKVLLLPILLAIFIMMLVDHWLWSLHFGILFFWLVMGLIVLDFSDNECYNNRVISNGNNQ